MSHHRIPYVCLLSLLITFKALAPWLYFKMYLLYFRHFYITIVIIFTVILLRFKFIFCSKWMKVVINHHYFSKYFLVIKKIIYHYIMPFFWNIFHIEISIKLFALMVQCFPAFSNLRCRKSYRYIFCKRSVFHSKELH